MAHKVVKDDGSEHLDKMVHKPLRHKGMMHSGKKRGRKRSRK